MIRTLVALMVLVAFTAQDCDVEIGNIVNRPGTITVTNIGADQVAVVAVIVGDAKSYPSLGPGSSASVTTNVGGSYEVRVVMTPENASAYRADLQSLRRLVEQRLDGTADAGDKTRLFVDLAGIKAAIRALENENAAGCSGRITLSTERKETVTATVAWSTTSGSGFWDITCGSS